MAKGEADRGRENGLIVSMGGLEDHSQRFGHWRATETYGGAQLCSETTIIPIHGTG